MQLWALVAPLLWRRCAVPTPRGARCGRALSGGPAPSLCARRQSRWAPPPMWTSPSAAGCWAYSWPARCSCKVGRSQRADAASSSLRSWAGEAGLPAAAGGCPATAVAEPAPGGSARDRPSVCTPAAGMLMLPRLVPWTHPAPPPGLRVAVLERGPLLGRAQEWNISRKELQELVGAGPVQELVQPAVERAACRRAHGTAGGHSVGLSIVAGHRAAPCWHGAKQACLHGLRMCCAGGDGAAVGARGGGVHHFGVQPRRGRRGTAACSRRH